MAAMTDRPPERDDRGQLILVTGLAVAVTLVAMVLLLNTVIYTQNLATRGAQIEDGEALEFRGEVVADVGGLLDAENREDYDTQSKVEENVTEAVFRYDHLLSRHHGERGTVAEIERESLSLTEGWLVRHTNESKDFKSANTAVVAGRMDDWTLAWSVSNARQFELAVNSSSLATNPDDGFQVVVAGNETSEEWRVYLYRDGATGDVTVAVDEGGSPTDVCSASGSKATVDLTAGTINGTDCPGLDWADGVDAPYDIQYRNGGEAKGRYGVTINKSEPDGVTDPVLADLYLNEPGSGTSPYYVHAVYAAEFEIHFETPRLVFHTAVRTAPGEPR